MTSKDANLTKAHARYLESRFIALAQQAGRCPAGHRRLPYEVFNDYPMIPGTRRSLSADLIIRSPSGTVLVAAEFKYEPSHSRLEFKALPGKLPVVFWGSEGVAKDITRIAQFVDQGVAESASSLFVDEGKHFRHRPPHPGSAWYDWPPSNAASRGPAVLRARR